MNARRIYWVLLTTVCLLWLVGCMPLSNDEIIAEKRKCEAAGMRGVQLTSMASGGRTQAVECRP